MDDLSGDIFVSVNELAIVDGSVAYFNMKSGFTYTIDVQKFPETAIY